MITQDEEKMWENNRKEMDLNWTNRGQRHLIPDILSISLSNSDFISLSAVQQHRHEHIKRKCYAPVLELARPILST